MPDLLSLSFMRYYNTFNLRDVDVWWKSSILFGGILILFLFVKTIKNEPERKLKDTDTSQQMNVKQSNKKPLLNVFDVSKLSQSNPSSQKASVPSDKPFGSSYYYAHNNPNATGGYKDGLRMEDYVMNQPKLLSKNGVPITTESLSEHRPGEEQVESVPVTKNNLKTSHFLHSISLNRYLWDDDGNSDGIAKIYFELLPSNTDAIKWQDAGITAKDVKLKLFQTESSSSLLLQIKRINSTTSKETRYHFYVSQLHGKVNQAQALVKSKCLVVKLIKEKKKGNRVAWSQVHAKGVAMKDFIDIDLFLEDSEH